MASSDIGLRELPYAPLPAGLDGSGFQVASLDIPDCPLEIRLVSGLCSDHDLMRGEEVQVLGLAGALEPTTQTVLVLPGTHSKHVTCYEREIVDFTTYFTGEMFQVLADHSILKGSVEVSGAGETGSASFAEGVETSLSGVPLLHAIFRVRVRDRMARKSPRENALYLSGLIIGSELAALAQRKPDQVWICAGKGLGRWYEKAVSLSALKDQTRIIPENMVETAVIRGHARLLDLQ
jgi:2-dehydro-3-deoxygalactonokinase